MTARVFVRDSLAVAASSYLARAVLIARGLVAAAALGPHGYGGWNALNLIYEYGTYASLGALQGLDLKLPGAIGDADRAVARRLMAGAWSMTLLGGLLYGLVLGVYLAAGGRAFSAWPNARLPLLMLMAVWIQLAIQTFGSSLRALGRFRAVSAGGALQALVGGGLGLALVWHQGIWGLLVGWNLGSLLALVVLWRACPEAPLVPSQIRTGFSLLKAGAPIVCYFALTTLLRSVDRIVLLRFGGEEPLGLYSLGLMAAGMVLYLPEAAAYVLFPRIAAAFHGARDLARTRAECVLAQRALVAFVPLAAGLGMVWAGPVVSALLPDFRGGLGALRALAVGAAAYSAATVPGYYLLAGARFRTLLGIAAAGTLVSALLVGTVAARAPAPTHVALAAALGYALFAAAILWAAAREWFERPSHRFGALAAGLVPAGWLALAWLVVRGIGSDASFASAALRTLALTALYAPVLAWLARGTGILGLLRDGLGRRAGDESG